MKKKIDNAYDAFWFLKNHPNCVDISPEHPIVYSMSGLNSTARKSIIDENRAYFLLEGQFINNLDINYVLINPLTDEIDDDHTLNTKTQVWLETGPAYWSEYTKKYETNSHDPKLDSAGDTFEEALMSLAQKVQEDYGEV